MKDTGTFHMNQAFYSCHDKILVGIYNMTNITIIRTPVFLEFKNQVGVLFSFSFLTKKWENLVNQLEN